jgi:hypothetical protein
MNAARVLFLCVALAAGGAAAFLVRSAEAKKSETPVVQIVAPDALITKRIVDVTTASSDQNRPWPARLSATAGGSATGNNT